MFFYLFICFTHAAITRKSMKELYSKYLAIDFDVESGQATGLSKEQNNMFYQLVYQKGLNEQKITKDHILLIWLQGGPGCSSQSAFYELIGPFRIAKSDVDFTIEKKDNSWSDVASILFIDQPFGTGFSYGEMSINSTLQASTYFVEFMVEFFNVHPEFLLTQTYLTGFSYTGHFAPLFSSSLLNSDIKFNYQGIIIGNGLQSVLHQIPSTSSYLFVNGYISDEFKISNIINDFKVHSTRFSISYEFLIELNITNIYKLYEIQNIFLSESIQQFITKIGNILQQDKLAGQAFTSYQNNLENLTKTDLTNILLKQEEIRSNDWISFMNKYKDQFGITNSITQVCNQQVKQEMESDFSFDLTKTIEDLLNKGTVLFYDGQMDASINHAGTQNWLSSLKSEQIFQWKSAQKSIFKSNGSTVGNFKKTEKFTIVTIYNAGHAAVYDQPQILYEMMKHHLNNDDYWN